MTKQEIEAELEECWEAYCQKVFAIAKKVKARQIDAFCAENNLVLSAGNGDWTLLPPDLPGHQISTFTYDFKYGKNIPEQQAEIIDLLELPVEGMPSDSLGTLMQDRLLNNQE